MDSSYLTSNEINAISQTRHRIRRLAEFFMNNSPPDNDIADEWFYYLAKFKDELGNFNNDISFFAILMAETYLINTLNILPFDSAAKAQGASGLDIDELARNGSRIIGEIKTTHPYKMNDLGAQQSATFKKDAEKLRRENAEHKFFFVTDTATFDIMKKPKYRQMFTGIKIVLLPFGAEINP